MTFQVAIMKKFEMNKLEIYIRGETISFYRQKLISKMDTYLVKETWNVVTCVVQDGVTLVCPITALFDL